VQARVHLYDRLFSVPDPDSADNFLEAVNQVSLDVLSDCMLERSLADVQAGTTVQFERLGYFCADPDTTNDSPVFNRTVTLRDPWAKIGKK
jgi:glutaminyl-tRNA synthetase